MTASREEGINRRRCIAQTIRTMNRKRRKCSRRRLLFSLWLILPLVLLMAMSVISVEASKSATSRQSASDFVRQCRKRKKGFSWFAALDSSTGIATSLETSFIPQKSHLHEALMSHTNHKQQTISAQKTVTRLLSLYPLWLARPRVTFGLLRAVPTRNKDKIESTCLQVALFGINLLTFGRCSKVKVVSTKSERTTRYTTTIPILGGVLAYMPRKNDKKQCGAIKFSLVNSSDKVWSLETEIANGYRPAIAGGAPVSWIRKCTYRSTQSLVHAYVMWRFHRYCYSNDDIESS